MQCSVTYIRYLSRHRFSVAYRIAEYSISWFTHYTIPNRSTYKIINGLFCLYTITKYITEKWPETDLEIAMFYLHFIYLVYFFRHIHDIMNPTRLYTLSKIYV